MGIAGDRNTWKLFKDPYAPQLVIETDEQEAAQTDKGQAPCKCNRHESD